jgi:hypothetical protein
MLDAGGSAIDPTSPGDDDSKQSAESALAAAIERGDVPGVVTALTDLGIARWHEHDAEIESGTGPLFGR